MLKRVSGFDIRADGSAALVEGDDPEAAPRPGAVYRWLHLDLAGEGGRDWCARRLPILAAMTLMQAETRPRCEDLGGGLIINLRGVNLDPDAWLEDMVSFRIWVAAEEIAARRQAVIMLRRFVVPQCEALARLAGMKAAPMAAEAHALMQEIANRAALLPPRGFLTGLFGVNVGGRGWRERPPFGSLW